MKTGMCVLVFIVIWNGNRPTFTPNRCMEKGF